MSKAAFKRAVGRLMKAGKIVITDGKNCAQVNRKVKIGKIADRKEKKIAIQSRLDIMEEKKKRKEKRKKYKEYYGRRGIV